MSHTQTTNTRFHARLAAAAVVLATLVPMNAFAQTPVQPLIMELRPHCDSVEYRAAFPDSSSSSAASSVSTDDTCPGFTIKDPTTKETPAYKVGDVIDLDLIVNNPDGKAFNRFRSWIVYDPSIFEGEVVEISKKFPTPTPDEQNFSPNDGYIKLSAVADQSQTGKIVVLGHIRLKVVKPSPTAIPVTFYDAANKVSSHTALFIKTRNQESIVALGTPGTLLLNVSSDGAASSAPTSVSSVISSMSSVASSVAMSAQSSSTSVTSSLLFNKLQVQRLKVTTEGSSAFLAWDALPSAELVGYNLYYSATSGKYIQKRGIDKGVTNMTIRALPVGSTYYFAVRGVNAKHEETDFSQEVAVTIGDPKTSTAPLTTSGKDISPKTPSTGGKVSGDTGPTSVLLLFLGLSAVIGTGLAFRRQLSARS